MMNQEIPQPTHKINKFLECWVFHADGEGPCRKCEVCGEWIRPRNFNGPCPGPRKK
jgi:hypothetical protein